MLDDNSIWSSEPDLESLNRAHKLLESDPSTAFKELEKLAQEGSIMSMVYMGSTYHNGSTIAKDDEKAEIWLHRASEAGSLFATHELGKLYLAKAEYAKAAELFSIGAECNYSPSLYRLATLYINGKGVAKDRAKAKSMLETSANIGNLFAKRALALALIKGELGEREILKGVFLYIAAFPAVIGTASRNPHSPELRS